MSHFTVGVILPLTADLSLIQSAVEALLAPFNEEIEVAPYQTACYCKGKVARNAGRAYAIRLMGAFHDLTLPDQRQSWVETADNYEQYHPQFGQFDPECDECQGSGVRTTTRNPRSKWDWWKIGGRWNNDLPNKANVCKVNRLLNDIESRYPVEPDESGPGYDFFISDWKHAVEQYLATPPDLRDIYAPFALLTPDGDWLEKGDMGWFGMVADEKDRHSWLRIVFATYEKYAAHTLVLVDAHI